MAVGDDEAVNLIMLGPPGAGKGTQSKLLSQRFSVPQVSTGDILRDAIKERTPLGLEARLYMDRGDLVRDGIVVGIIEDRLQRKDCSGGFVLDGFPRTLAQAEALDAMLSGIRKSLDAVLCLEVNAEELIKRLSGRRVCKSCGAEYHTIFHPSDKGERCGSCDGDLVQRSDDREEVIRERLRVYREKTEPLVGYYSSRGLVRRIQGQGSMEEIQERLLRAIDEGASNKRAAAS